MGDSARLFSRAASTSASVGRLIPAEPFRGVEKRCRMDSTLISGWSAEVSGGQRLTLADIRDNYNYKQCACIGIGNPEFLYIIDTNGQ